LKRSKLDDTVIPLVVLVAGGGTVAKSENKMKMTEKNKINISK